MKNKGMSEIVQGIARIVFPFIALYGISLVLYGHITPGGGFAGGVILTGGFVLLLLAFGKEYTFRFLPVKIAKGLDSAGALGFLSIALLGFAGGVFFYNLLPKGYIFHLWSAGTIIICNIMIGIKVASALFVAIAILSMARLIHTKEGIKYKQSVEEDQ
ncbi:MAG TPA: MnhB domain-containing protein [bacterium]|nr:MnhB domain-containing protein [bacterium]